MKKTSQKIGLKKITLSNLSTEAIEKLKGGSSYVTYNCPPTNATCGCPPATFDCPPETADCPFTLLDCGTDTRRRICLMDQPIYDYPAY
jgi:hypothetical protein